MQPSEQVTHHGELFRTVRQLAAFDEPRYEDRAESSVCMRTTWYGPYSDILK